MAGMLQQGKPVAAVLQAPKKAAAAGGSAEGGDQGGAYEEAMGMARKALYEAEAARDVAKAMRSAPSPEQGLADTAYEMVSIVDEATQGRVPDEDLVPLAAEILGEVADIAQAAGVQVKGSVIAKAMQLMLVRYVTEQGMDPSQLQAAMAQVDTEQLGAKLEQGA